MEEHHRDDGFEATFVVSASRVETWQRLEAASPVSDRLPRPAPGQWWVPGVEGAADPLEVAPERRLHVRKATQPCQGTEIVVTLEDADTGTRITFAQFGFGSGFEAQRAWLEAGWWAIRADLFVYFEHGTAPGRHLRPWSSLGCTVRETPGGLVASAVAPGSLAAAAGLRDGDLLLTVQGSPVVTVRELAAVVRAFRAGSEATLRFLRGREVCTGSGSF